MTAVVAGIAFDNVDNLQPVPNPIEEDLQLVPNPIEEILSKAEQAFQEQRLSSPPGDSAWFYYNKVLAIDPDNEKALRGLNNIADEYAVLVESELKKFHYNRAKFLLYRGLEIQPDNERLIALKKETNVLTHVPKKIFKNIKSLFN